MGSHKRNGFSTLEEAQALQTRIREDAGSHVSTSIETDICHSHYILVTLISKNRKIDIRTYSDWESYWGCWSVLLEQD